MKAIARSFVYWPGLDEEIVSFVNSCRHCASVARSPPKEEPESWRPTTAPWQRIHADYAGPLDGEYYLLIIDAHTKWPEIFPTRQTTSKCTINLMRTLFANKGMPEFLVTDNGTQFKSAKFAEFCSENGICHITTAPFHPQSNGQAERFVDTFKRAIKKIQEGEGSIKKALDIFLLTYRSTPNPNVLDGKSPAEAMYNRPLRTSLDLLRPPSYPKAESNHQCASRVRFFNSEDCVYVKIYSNNKWSWVPGTVVEKIGTVMYNIWVENRKLIRSHINQLRKRSTSGTVAESKVKQGLPLNILLDEWKLSIPTPTVPQSAQFSKIDVPEQSQSTLVPASPSTPESRLSTTTSSSPPSTAFESAVETEPIVQQPRRSSRNRRPPTRFQAYLRY